MNKFGIIQGRLLPNNKNLLQKFPSKKWKKEFYLIKKFGFNYLELLYDREESPENPIVNGKFSEIKKLKKKYKISTPNLCVEYLTKFPAEKWEDKSEEIENKMSQIIKKSKILGVKNLIIPVIFSKPNPRRKNIKKIFQFLKKIKLKFNTNILLETNISTKKISRQLLKNRNIKICLDLGNLKGLNFNLHDEIKDAKNQIGLVHIKDKKKNSNKNQLLGKGDVDFKESFKTLRKIKYKGNYTLETAHGNYPALNASKQLNIIKHIFKK